MSSINAPSLIRAQLIKADDAVRSLTLIGLVVTSVQIDAFQNRPVVSVSPSPRCNDLAGVPVREVKADGTQDTYMQATVGGCLVQWRNK